MSLTDRPAPARTDVPTTAGSAQVPAQRGRRQHEPLADPPTASWVRRRALVLVAGGALWAVSKYAFGMESPGLPGRIVDATSLLFQVGVVALLTVMVRTRATGTSRLARGFLKAEFVLLGLAMLNTVLWVLFEGLDSPVVAWTDPFWPISMLGMWIVGIRIAIAGRWRGALRFWPCVAEAYFPLVMGSVAVFGWAAAGAASATVVLLGYTAMGVILAARPDLVGARA